MLVIQKQRFFISASLLFLACTGLCFGQSAWTQIRPFITRANLRSIIYGPNQIVAVGDSGTIVSHVASEWHIEYSGTTNYLECANYGKGKFVVLGGNIVLTSPEAINWTIHEIDTSYYPSSVIYGDSQYVAVGWNGIILTSPDAITWTKRNSNTTYWLKSVVYGGGQYVAVGWYGAILTSPNAITWTKRNSDTTYFLTSITYGNGMFVAVGDGGEILTSPNGTMWTKNADFDDSFYSVTYGNGQFVAVGSFLNPYFQEEGSIIYSSDGILWKNSNFTPYPASGLSSVTYDAGGQGYAAVGLNGTIIFSHSDNVGINQKKITSTGNNPLKIKLINNHISVILPYALAAGTLKVKIFTVAGKTIYSAMTVGNNGILNIPIAGFSQGIYYISINNDDLTLLTSGFVVTK